MKPEKFESVFLQQVDQFFGTSFKDFTDMIHFDDLVPML